MKNLKYIAASMAALILVSCGTATKNGALIGGGGGAAIGALIGSLVSGHGDHNKGALIGAAIGGAVGGTAGTLIGKKMDKAKAAAEAVKNAQVETVTINGLEAVKVTFDNGILFNVGKSDLQAAAKTTLAQFANEVLNVYTDCDVAVLGFASSDGDEAKNLTLSQNRAYSVSNYLTGSCSVKPAQIKQTQGLGEDVNYLVRNADGTENLQASRRVEVYLLASEQMIQAAQNGTLKY